MGDLIWIEMNYSHNILLWLLSREQYNREDIVFYYSSDYITFSPKPRVGFIPTWTTKIVSLATVMKNDLIEALAMGCLLDYLSVY